MRQQYPHTESILHDRILIAEGIFKSISQLKFFIMRKFLTHFFTMMLLLSITTLHAQTTIWPIASDSATIKASQFADTTQIFQSKTATPNPPAGFKGWISRPLLSDDPAKKDNTQWIWTKNTTSRGAYGGNRGLNAPTSANGSAFFDSNFYDDGGVAANAGTGLSPSPHAAELISPIMNTTGFTDIIVQFHQIFRNFSARTTVAYSTDGGTTWSPDIRINDEIAANASTTNPVIATNTDSTRKRVTLAGSVGSANFRIKFKFDGDYYYWAIDDVSLINFKYYDMQVNTTFYAIPPSLYTPVNQLDTIRFLADVSNVGTNAMNNVKLQVKVWRASDTALIYNSTNSEYPVSFKADTAYENRLLPLPLLPSAISQVGRYFGSYRVFGDSSKADINPANDTVRFTFWVSDTSTANSVVSSVGKSNYTKENGLTVFSRLGNGYWTGTEPRSVRYGNYYRINKVPATITSIIANLNAKAAAGRRLQGSLYEWKDANKDGVVQASERTLAAAADTLVPTSVANTNAWYLFRLVDINTNKPFYAKANTDYLAMVEFDAPSIAAPVDSNYIIFVFNQSNYNYGAMRYVTDSVGSPRYSIILGKTADSDWSTGGFTNQTLVPVVRLNVLPFLLANTTTVLSSNNKMVVSPNPVGQDNVVNIQIDLEKASDVLFRVMTVDGRLMAEQVMDKFQKQNIELQVNDYPSGTYLIQILTPDGIMTKRFVKTK